MWRDAKFGLRTLRRSPTFTIVAVLTLAIGIGANLAIFSVMLAVLLRPLPYPEPERLVAVIQVDEDKAPLLASFTKFTQVKEQSKTLSEIAAYFPLTMSLATKNEAEPVSAARASKDLFAILGATPALGRSFSTEEDQSGGADVVVISDGFWHSHFGADAELLGRAVTLDGRSMTVIGILPPAFKFPILFPEPDVWLPRVFETTFVKPELVHSGASYLALIARMRQGETVARVQAELHTINARYKQEFANFADASRFSLTVQPIDEALIGTLRPSLLLLQAAVGLVLLIACANVANMLLVRATTRQKEIAIRQALGATRAQLVRHLLTESAVLSLGGGVLGVALAAAFLPIVRSIAPGTVPRLEQTSLNVPVLLCSLGLSAVATFVFGLVPALQVSGRNLRQTLDEGGRGSSDGARRNRVRATLVVAEVAVALILMTGAGLLTKSFVRMLDVDPGFESKNVMTFPITLPAGRYPEPEQQSEFFRRLVEAAKNLPNVQAAAVTTYLPLAGPTRFVFFCPEGLACQGLGKDPVIAVRQVTPDYFKTMRTPLLQGRVFSDQDTATSQQVVIVNQAVANRYWPNQNALGKHLANSRDKIPRVVVGVAANVKYNNLTAPISEEMYLPLPQNPGAAATLIVRSQSDAQPVVAAVRRAVGQIDTSLAISGIQSLNEVVSTSVAQPRLLMQFVGAFAILALFLSAIGIYAVMGYAVSRRRQEIGIRMALGAQRVDILSLVLRHGMGLTLIGVACGGIASFGLTRLLAGLLFDIHATDPIAFSGAAFLLAVTALLACYLPARKASRLDPMLVLRND
jgi:putative ABC transport system permease protein